MQDENSCEFGNVSNEPFDLHRRMMSNEGKHVWSVEMTDSVMKRDPLFYKKWAYDYGVVLKGVEAVWRNTQEQKYFDYIKTNLDVFINADGTIWGYELEEFNIDHVNNGKQLLLLYTQTGDERYKKAANLLREQLRRHPRTSAGGFWHKKIYPHQMWLDGLYMGSPFYAEYAKMFGEPEAFDEIANQFILMNKYARDNKTGLLYHGWDESREQRWANPETGCSPNFWGRAMGWYAMAIVDVLDYFPGQHPQRGAIIDIFKNMVEALLKVQDQASGVWYQVLDQGGRIGNYLEASASCMFVYAFTKAVRKGYISREYLTAAQKGYDGILTQFIEVNEEGLVNLKWVCMVAGLGNIPYRDGSFQYYISEPVRLNDPKGVGAFILASAEIEHLT
jgi:unsaturated rhamnogalacturonyl hydrolase